jgi:hypothetical protein
MSNARRIADLLESDGDVLLAHLDNVPVSSVNGSTGAIVLTHDGFSDFVANEHIDWTADQGATNLHSGNYTDNDTTYSVGDAGLTEKNFTTALNTKLSNIATSANLYVHPSGNCNTHIPCGGSSGQFLKYTSAGTAVWASDNDTTYSVGDAGLTQKNFTTTLKTKLDAIEASATADQTNAEIKTAYEANSDTNEFSDAEQTKLSGIATSANLYVHPNHSGDVTSSADGATTIADNAVSLSKMANMSTASFIGRSTSSAGDPEVLSATTARSVLNVEDGATADQTNAEIKTAYEANSDTNEFSDAEQTKLAAIEASATADQTNAQIKTAYEANSDTNEFSDAEQTKLAGVAASANNYSLETASASALGGIKVGSNLSIASGVLASSFTNTEYTAGTGITLTGTTFSAAPVALTTVQTAANQTAQLALTAQEGDVVVRSDENKSYMHNGGSAGTMADYTLLATPTDTVLSVNGATGAVSLTHDGFSDFVANEHLDWTADQGATNLHSGNYTDTTYSVGDGGLTQVNFTSADNTKLDAIEASATADQTNAEIKTAYEANADTNEFSDAEQTKLSGIETSADVTDTINVTAAGALMDSELAGLAAVKATTGTFLTADQTKLDAIEASATADQTNAEIKTAYEANSDTNEFSDAEQTKLAAIEAAATADQTNAEIKTAIAGAVGTSELSATGTKSATTYLSGSNTWTEPAGGATGGGTDEIFYENGQTVTTAYTLTTDKNAMSAGPISIGAGATVSVPSGSSWAIIL